MGLDILFGKVGRHKIALKNGRSDFTGFGWRINGQGYEIHATREASH
jgi:hypothetical protein